MKSQLRWTPSSKLNERSICRLLGWVSGKSTEIGAGNVLVHIKYLHPHVRVEHGCLQLLHLVLGTI